MINAFVLPAIYLLVTFVFLFNNFKKQTITLTDSFVVSIFSLVIGGSISFICILLFLNYVDPPTHVLLKNQFYNTYISNINVEGEDKEKAELLIKQLTEAKNNTNVLFTRKYIIMFTFMQNSFYLLVSVFFTIFFRATTPK